MPQTVPVLQKEQRRPSVWERLCRYSFTRSRISRKSLNRFCSKVGTSEYTLVVHCPDFDHRRYFPNSYIVSKKKNETAHLHTDKYFEGLNEIAAGSFRVIVCTGLLEHIPDPERLVREFHRILAPGGRLIISASAVFPFHGAPDNFFHFTPNGFRHLFREWSGFEILQGSTKPFETIAVLLQRINLQCDVFPPARPLIEIMFRVAPLFDVFVLRQFDNYSVRNDTTATDSIMPATLHGVVVR